MKDTKDNKNIEITEKIENVENPVKTVDFQKMFEDLQATLKEKEAENAALTAVNSELQNELQLGVIAKERNRPTMAFEGKNYEVNCLKFKHEDQEYMTLDLVNDELGKNVLRAILQRPGQRLLVEITK